MILEICFTYISDIHDEKRILARRFKSGSTTIEAKTQQEALDYFYTKFNGVIYSINRLDKKFNNASNKFK